MTANSDNRRRAFTEVVTIDAWHDAFSSKSRRADLHADVFFGEGRVGGERESPVRFRLSLKRAVVTVVIPESEPVRADRSSLARGPEPAPINRTTTTTKARRVAAKGTANATIGPSSTSLSLEGSVDGAASAETTVLLEQKDIVRIMIVKQVPSGNGRDYSWIVKTTDGAPLDGKPWSGAVEPRLTLVDTRKNNKTGIPPSVRLEVTCLREDILINDIEIKDAGLFSDLKNKLGFENRLAAAEAYIRDQLVQSGLEVDNISDKFGHIMFASTLATGE